MKPETKRKLIIAAGIIEAVIVLFLFIVSIIALATMGEKDVDKNSGNFIKILQNNPTLFLCVVVVPLVIFFVIDGLYLLYIYLASKKADETAQQVVSSLSEEEKAQLLAEAKKELEEEAKNSGTKN